jgi:uncharacterized membrane protein YfcA
MTAKTDIFIALAGFALAYVAVFAGSLWRLRAWNGSVPPARRFLYLATGFVTNFFDTLGIGSFATTTAIFKFKRMLADELFPGTLNAGHTLPVIFQAFIYIAVIKVDVTTLVLMIASAVAGAWIGAGLVAGLSRRTVQFAMGGTLLAAAVALLARQFDLFPLGGESLQLEGWRLIAGMAGNFVFAAISTLGVGFYAPCMTLVSLLGMNPAAAFPIMMGSGAFLMPVASIRFIWRGAYYAPVAAGLAVGGLLGVPLAAFVVKSIPLTGLRWLVIVVVLYAAVLMLQSALGGRRAEANSLPASDSPD